MQKEPYKGDVINSYNDGPLEMVEQMGPFYEIDLRRLRSALKHGEQQLIRKSPLHFQGAYAALRTGSWEVLQVDLRYDKKIVIHVYSFI